MVEVRFSGGCREFQVEWVIGGGGAGCVECELGALLRRLRGGVVTLALLAGRGLVVPGRVGAQRRGVVEAVLVVDAVGGVELRVLQPRDQALVLVAELAAHQRGLAHHHHVLQGGGEGEAGGVVLVV